MQEEKPTGTLALIAFLTATILVFWFGVLYLFLSRG